MRVQLVVAASKYTGAAAVAELATRALRTSGVDARLLFRRGRNLEARLAGAKWAEPGLQAERKPGDLVRALRVLKARSSECDVMMPFLPHDLFAVRLARAADRAAVVWNLRNPGHLRRDPLHRFAMSRLAGVIVPAPQLARRWTAMWPGRPAWCSPVPLEDRFSPGCAGERWRKRLGIPLAVPVLGMVGKVASGRGFARLLETAAQAGPTVKVLAVGHGEARPSLEERARQLGIHERVHWAGYQEQELPELYAAMDVVLFAAAGSDWGHRAISEAQACGRPVVAADIEGVDQLIVDGETGVVIPGEPDAMARAVRSVLDDPDAAARFGDAAARVAEQRRFAVVGNELRDFLEQIVGSADGRSS